MVASEKLKKIVTGTLSLNTNSQKMKNFVCGFVYFMGENSHFIYILVDAFTDLGE